MHKENCFVTLTYNDDNLPPDLSLDKRAFQLFMKRLRKRVKVPIRFFACGECLGSTRLHFGMRFRQRFD